MKKYVPRTEWGARKAKARHTPLSNPKGIAVHWVGATLGKYRHDTCADRVRGTQAYHMDNNGWNDIAYSFMVCRHGWVFQGRGWGKRTAANGTDAGNSWGHAVCAIAGPGDPITWRMKWAIRRVRRAHRNRYGKAALVTHSYFKPTACPGPDLEAWVKKGGPRR